MKLIHRVHVENCHHPVNRKRRRYKQLCWVTVIGNYTRDVDPVTGNQVGLAWEIAFIGRVTRRPSGHTVYSHPTDGV